MDPNLWHQITARNLEREPRQAVDVITVAIKELYKKNGQQKGAEIRSNNMPRGSDPRNRVYFFNPQASEICTTLLRDWSQPCQQPDDYEHLPIVWPPPPQY
jgi:hypothetical protein